MKRVAPPPVGNKRTVDVWVVLQTPEPFRDLVKDVTVSVHSQNISEDSRAVRVPWTNAIRLTGMEDIFAVRIKVPANMPIYVHVVALVEEPGVSHESGNRRRHIGFKNLTLDPEGADSDVVVTVSHFETYVLHAAA